MSLKLNVVSRGKPERGFPVEMNVPANATLAELKRDIQMVQPRLTTERQRLTTEDKVPLLEDDKTLESLNLRSGDKVYVKDLGPQIGWRTVFFVEYAGPLLIHPLVYLLAPHVWASFGLSFTYSTVQQVTLVLVLLHFAKREFESAFIHRFSNSTMPAFNIFKNSGHYWLLSGVLLSIGIYSPFEGQQAVRGTVRDDPRYIGAFVIIWTLAELGNFYSHYILMTLRPKGTRVRQIPRGFAFELVSCPNYFFEMVAWVAITLMNLSLSALIFTVVSTAQMTVWAIKKHKAYRREFQDKYPRSRKIMYPFVY